MVGTVATLRQEKNLDLLINAFAALGGTHTLRIAGNGPMRAHLEALVLKRGLEDRVVFVGHIHDVPAFLAELDLFCITSTTEQMPISLLEAMAAGLPVVCTNVGDIAEMVAETNREWVVAEYDFTATLRLAVNSPDRWGAMSRDNFLRVSHEYAESAMLSRFRSMLHDVCHANAS